MHIDKNVKNDFGNQIIRGDITLRFHMKGKFHLSTRKISIIHQNLENIQSYNLLVIQIDQHPINNSHSVVAKNIFLRRHKMQLQKIL